MSRRLRSACSGVSLIELVVSLTLLTIGLLGTAATAHNVAASLRESGLSIRGRVAARSALEEILAGPAGRLAAGRADHPPLRLSWTVGDGIPREVVMLARTRLPGAHVGDTLVTLAP